MRPPILGPTTKGPPLRPTQAFESFPIIANVSPSASRVVGGDTVTITGSRFAADVTVLFGDEPALSVVVVSSGEIQCESPAHDEGVVDITVINNHNGEEGVRIQAYTFVEGHIVGVSNNRGSVVGGTELSIIGFNFIAGALIYFGGELATGIEFVDDTMYRAITPAHASGLVDIEIVELSGYTIVGKFLFSYTAAVFGGDIRRSPSVTVTEATDGGSNTAGFVIDGSGTPPVGLERTTFKDKLDNILFSGQVTSFSQSYEDARENFVWSAGCTDHSYRFNRLRPFGVFNNVSASDVAEALISAYAPGFLTNFIQARLPKISMALDGSEDMLTVFSNIASKIGNGHFYLDYNREVHLYKAAFEEPSLPPVTIPGFGAAAMTVALSTTSALGQDLKEGYWYFFTTFRYGTAKTFTTPHPSIPIPPSPGYVQLSDQAMALNMTGTVSNGSYGLGFSRGWVMYDVNGVKIGEGWAGHQPPVAGDVNFATQDVATVMENLAGGGLFESKLSALAGPIYLDGTLLPTFSNIPIGPAVGSRNPTARVIYAIRIGDSSGVGGTGLIEYAVIADNVTTTATPALAIKPSTISRTLPPPVAPIGVLTAIESTTEVDDGGAFPERDAQPGYWSFRVTGVYQDGTETRGTQQTLAILLNGSFKATLSNIPIFPPIGTLNCVFRKIYASIFTPFIPIVEGTPDFDRTSTKMVGLILDNTSNVATFAFGMSLVGGERSVTNQPPGIEDELGPDLEAIIAPDIIDDDNDSMIKTTPVTLTLDWSQLRNRVFVRGKGTIMALDAAAGTNTITVADTSRFNPTGGFLSIGHRVIAYASILSTAQIKLAAPLTQAIIQADWLFGGGTPVRPFLQMDDVESQKLCGLVEIDDNGLPTDGIHEFMVTDDNLLTFPQMVQRGLTELKGAWPVRTVTYATRDPKSHRGVTVPFNLTYPPIFGDFVISDVMMDQFYDESDELEPRYNVTATSSSRFTFNDFLRYLDDKTGKGSGGVFPIPNVYSSLNTTGGTTYHEVFIASTSAILAEILLLNGTTLSCSAGPTQTGKIAKGYAWKLASAGSGANPAFASNDQPIFLEHLPQCRTIVMSPTTAEGLRGNGSGYQWGIAPRGLTGSTTTSGAMSGIYVCSIKGPSNQPTLWSVIVRNMTNPNIAFINETLFEETRDTIYDIQINMLSTVSFQVIINDFQKTFTFPSEVFPAFTAFAIAGQVGGGAAFGMWCRYAKVSSSVIV